MTPVGKCGGIRIVIGVTLFALNLSDGCCDREQLGVGVGRRLLERLLLTPMTKKTVLPLGEFSKPAVQQRLRRLG